MMCLLADIQIRELPKQDDFILEIGLAVSFGDSSFF